MHIEGSRHEKVAIVIATYVIGFITAYIAFGINADETIKTLVVTNTISQQAAVAESAAASSEKVRITDKGLIYTDGQTERLISVNVAVLQNATSFENTPGVHTAVHGLSVSPTEQFVYYCEQQFTAETDCVPFLYDVTNDMVHFVSHSDANPALPIDSAQAYWTSDGRLSLGTFNSQSPLTPWQ